MSVNGTEKRYFLTTKPGKTGSYLQKSKVLINTTIAKPDEFLFTIKI